MHVALALVRPEGGDGGRVRHFGVFEWVEVVLDVHGRLLERFGAEEGVGGGGGFMGRLWKCGHQYQYPQRAGNGQSLLPRS